MRRRQVAPLAALLAVISLPACGPSMPSGGALEKECRDLSTRGRWAEALAACRRAEAARPDDPELALRTARALHYLGRADEALTAARSLFGSAVDGGARELAGMIQVRRMDEAGGRELLQQALAAHLAAGDHAGAARALQELAGSFHRERRFIDALDAAERCIEESVLARKPRNEGYGRLILAKVLTELGDDRGARRALVEAGSLLAPWAADVSWVHLTHGILLLQLDEAEEAIAPLTRARDLARESRVRDVVAAATINLAEAERKAGRFGTAEQHLGELEPEMQSHPLAVLIRGLIAAGRGDHAAAERHLALAAVAPPDDDYARDIAFERGRVAERAGELAAAEERFRESIAIVENIRGRARRPELRAWVLRHRRAPYEALLALHAGQGRRLEALEVAETLQARSWRESALGASGHRGPLAAQPVRQRAAALDGVGRVLQETGPATTHGPLALAGDREVLLYLEAHGSLWRFHIAGRRVAELVRLPGRSMAVIETWASDPDRDDLAEELGELLVPDQVVAGREPLYIVASDRLASLPFPALRRSGRLLVDDRPLVRLPGLAAFQCRSRAQEPGPAVVVGDPTGDLPAARREAELAARRLNVPAHVGESATVARVRAARRASILHVAAHAESGGAGGVLPLWGGNLTSTDILEGGIAPRLVVLTGCGTSASRDGDGLGSLSSAFLAAGSATVVATLRPVLDREAAELTDLFYEHGGAARPAHALAAAQRALARSSRTHDWAHFAVWGDPDLSSCSGRTARRDPIFPAANARSSAPLAR